MTAEAALAAQCEAPTHDAKELVSLMKIRREAGAATEALFAR
jgi:hypothetical protein